MGKQDNMFEYLLTNAVNGLIYSVFAFLTALFTWMSELFFSLADTFS